jgi:alpha-tubulin suppressor-like RCC1 family protein
MSSQYETSSGFTTSSSSSSSASSPTAIFAGYYHNCALIDNASVKCWGQNTYGQLGIDNDTHMGDNTGDMAVLPSIDLGTGRTATAIGAGNNHNCAILDNASVKCWGYNRYGQLGIDNTTHMGDNSSEMAVLPSIDLGTGRTATAIEAGINHSCALLDNASVKCWGQNGYGQLGIGNTTNMGDGSGEMGDNLPVVDLGTGRTATAIDAGGNHSCALLDNASVKCWGLNGYGQLGIDNTTQMGDNTGEMGDNLPVVYLGTGRTATAISAGIYHSCALLDNASVKCWGRNTFGQLGIDNDTHMGDNSSEMAVLPPIDLGTGRTATAIEAGGYHSCALLDNASVKCWGQNTYGQLGIGNTARMGDGSGEMGDNLPVVNLGTGRTATAIATGCYHTCALLDNASVKCWGFNYYGQLGIGNTTAMGDGSGEMAVLPSIDL